MATINTETICKLNNVSSEFLSNRSCFLKALAFQLIGPYVNKRDAFGVDNYTFNCINSVIKRCNEFGCNYQVKDEQNRKRILTLSSQNEPTSKKKEVFRLQY